MNNWAFFLADDCSELTRGWQGTETQARRFARQTANELGQAVEFILESELGHGEPAGEDYEPPQGEIVEPSK